MMKDAVLAKDGVILLAMGGALAGMLVIRKLRAENSPASGGGLGGGADAGGGPRGPGRARHPGGASARSGRTFTTSMKTSPTNGNTLTMSATSRCCWRAAHPTYENETAMDHPGR